MVIDTVEMLRERHREIGWVEVKKLVVTWWA
jgi:hypothetical protein